MKIFDAKDLMRTDYLSWYKGNNDDGDPKKHISIRIIGTQDLDKLDPAIFEFLPPEIREAIGEKKVTDGSDGELPPIEKEEVEEQKQVEKIKYNFKMINCNQDLKTLTEKLKKSKTKKWNMLLYGESGSGKSYYAKYLAQELGLRFMKLKCSDIVEKWVGATEKNLREAFRTARKKNALLCFDEADSFLFSRTNMDRDFSIQAVNEMLVQLEEHDLPVILTTNLRDKLDVAMNRRVLFKVCFEFMKPENVKEGIKAYFGKEFSLPAEKLKELKYLTAGDFQVVKDKAAVLDDGIYTNDLIYDYLSQEQKEKDVKEGSGEISL